MEIQSEQLVLFEKYESDVVMVKLSWNWACTVLPWSGNLQFMLKLFKKQIDFTNLLSETDGNDGLKRSISVMLFCFHGEIDGQTS